MEVLANLAMNEVQLGTVNAQQRLGTGERYHETIRKTYNAKVEDHIEINLEIALRFMSKCIGDTMRPEALVPTLIVLEYFLHFLY